MINLKLFRENSNSLLEWNAVGKKHKDGIEWLKSLGYEPVTEKGDHPKWRHKETGFIATGWNHHGKDIKPDALRRTRTAIKAHHEEKNLPYWDF
jgi:predicted RNA binding protein YcfA (HicA-like mRNA interferase family)